MSLDSIFCPFCGQQFGVRRARRQIETNGHSDHRCSARGGVHIRLAVFDYGHEHLDLTVRPFDETIHTIANGRHRA